MSLSADVKDSIQQHYREFLKAKSLNARLGQKQMIAHIANQLGQIETDSDNKRTNEQHIAVVEAGTGTGKTIAYLLAVIPFAKAMGKKVVISTATIALQEQIIHKDLPDLKKNTSLSFRFSLAKGRGRYLCLTKLDRLLNEGAEPDAVFYDDESSVVDEQSLPLYQKMMDKLSTHSWDGDRDAWPDDLTINEWQPVTTNHQQCTGRRCSNVTHCSFFKARESNESVDCIVANHDLVLADLALGGGAILSAPEDTIYIFDEGHHLPDKALGHFAYHSRLLSTQRFFEQAPGQLDKLLDALSEISSLSALANDLPSDMALARRHLDRVYRAAKPLMDDIYEEPKRHRFQHGQVPDSIAQPAADLVSVLTRLLSSVVKLSTEIEEVLEERYFPVTKSECERWYSLLGQWQSRLEANLSLWQTYADTDIRDIPIARWLTAIDTGNFLDFEVCSSPILSANHLQKSLWAQCFGAVLTSATLTALQQFERFIMRSGINENQHFSVVPSPFDHSRAELVVPPESIEGNLVTPHTESVIEQLPDLIQSQLGTLVLFSSRRQMLDVFDGMDEPIKNYIIVQGDRNKQVMLDEHKARINSKKPSVIFGLASFAEGVDLPGAFCEHVIIAKLPFSVPSDPIEASLSEWFEAQGRNPFLEITIPDASVKLVQACGRLLRTERDAGRITILDKRLLTKRYGRILLQSLPYRMS